ncbi:hypothetical protein [Clostridium estertheticum]|uniref:Lipoprotein n=1 Tax=Clostridium estertheticum TaxID=238834 RepID=A0A7Y3SSL7_9CLOT|nr:hypothetical protein [Clostridium estertheticum]MBW9172278.1 hypothetical protein [Clostridium estertheticum]NNU74616.1 hypothetical protein [Clostridium estertheticum]WBL48890.1 hypothetical protein LOR37_09600 [Clostridium estertheticum]WLC76942.1 hypothetical protein KTC99_09185 [Clostridium estertheticum]
MIKTKKMLALGVGLIMTTSLFAGCSTDGFALVKSFTKSQTINSMQSKTDISLKVSGTNMSIKEKQMMDTVLPSIDGTKISMVTKTNQNEDRTISKMQSDISLQLVQSPDPINMSIWVDTDITGEKPVINELYKIPKLLSSQLPTELKGKEYMAMDLANMPSTPGMPKTDYKKLMAFSKEFQPKLTDFIVKYAKQFNPTTKYVTYIGSQSFLQDNVMQSSNTYEVKLNDKSFKDLMHYTLNNLSDSKDAMSFTQDYMKAMMSVYDVTGGQDKTSKDEINKAFGDITTQLPQQLKSMNKSLESIDNLKILGDKGITIRYTINKDGYIVNEKGNAEFVIDLPSINKLSGTTAVASNSDQTGIYTVGVDFNTDITNINKNIDIVLPKTNSTNSFNYNDILKLDNTKLPTN